MADCKITSINSKACSGKCRSGSCSPQPRVWIVAACGGMISLFEKEANGHISPKQVGEHVVFASLEQFQKSMNTAEHAHAFDQLLVIGSGSDIAWVHSSLPESVARHIAAEIEYPLLPGWFKEQNLTTLSQAIGTIVAT